MGQRIFRNTAVNPAEGTLSPATARAIGGGRLDAARKGSGSVDFPLLLAMIAMLTFGLLMVYSASYDFSYAVYGDASAMFLRQLLWLAIGVVTAYILSRVDYHHWRALIVPAMLGTIALLVAVLAINEIRLGAARTFLSGSVQPSELAKVITVIYLAVWLHSKQQQLHDISWGLMPLAVILGIIGGLIYLQPDLSATATIFALGGLLFFLAGGDLKQIAILLVIALLVGFLVVQVSATGRERLNSYFLGIKDPLQASYHVRRSLEAIVKGGWFGVGLGRSETKHLGLPVPPTDSIFAVIAEELGLFGALGTLILYGVILWRGLQIAKTAPDMLGSLLASGLTFWIALEAAINMLVIVGLMPFAGNALPFISSGGSNLTASLAAIGILMNISRQNSPESESTPEWRNLGAIFDLRGRHGRRSLSRTGRS
ncbi:MAG: putative lipid II flippase FtsW [Anaerolineales bacterium]